MAPKKNVAEMSDSDKLSLIILLVQGNPLDEKDKGIVGDISWLKNQVRSLNQLKTQFIGWLAGAFAAGSVAASVIYFILSKK